MSITLHFEVVHSSLKTGGKRTYSQRYLFLVRIINIHINAKNPNAINS